MLASVFFAAPSRGEEPACASTGAPWVRLSLEGAYFAEPLRARVLRQIRTDLERKGLAVCESGEEGAPVAEMRMTLARPASLSIELQDEVSRERFAREISLAEVPNDALAFSIAATAEELLYASWAQNAVAHAPVRTAAPPSPAPPPPAPIASPAALPSTSPEPAISVGARPGFEAVPKRPTGVATSVYVLGAGETATQGETGLGADVGVTWGGRAALGARAGFRLAPTIASPHGSVEMREAIVGLTGSLAFVRRSAVWGGEALVHGNVLYVAFDGVAGPAARALSGSALGLVLSAGLGGWVRVARSWRVIGEVTGGAPVHSVTASDSGDVVTGIGGLVIGFALGLATQI